MRDQFAPVIEGFDCDGITSPWSFQCESFNEDGGNGGTMLDGTTVQDVLAVKNRFSWALNVLTMARYNALISALDKGAEPDTVSAIVYDPATDTQYRTTFHVTPPVFRLVPDIGGATVAIPDSPLVLEETGGGKAVDIIDGDWWKLYDDGFLDIYCNGNMPNYNISGAPWYAPGWTEKTQVTSIAIRNSVTSIGTYAFDSCNYLTNVTIPDSVTDIGDYAFRSCIRLISVTIPDSVTNIGNYAFWKCTSLTSVTIGNSVRRIRDFAFWNTGLTNVTIPDSVNDIGRYAFASCTSLISVTIGNGIKTIGEYAFRTCTSLTSVVISDSVYNYDIEIQAFYQCTSLTSVTIGNGIKTIGGSAFSGCTSLTSVMIGDSATYIYVNAFANCTSLTSVTIPDSVYTIGRRAFYYCTSLTSVTIPSHVTSIDENAFYGTSLESVTISSRAWVGTNAFPPGCVINYY